MRIGRRAARAVTFFVLSLLLGLLLAFRADAADLYASPGGHAGAAGTQADPLDLPSAVGTGSPVKPGDTLWLLPGVYHYQATYPAVGNLEYGFDVQLVGTSTAPVTIRGVDDASGHAIIDGGIQLQPPATHVILQDFEVTCLTPRAPATWPDDISTLPYQWGGVWVASGDGDELLGLVVHGNCQGLSVWQAATNTLVKGCLVYHNGWVVNADGSGAGHEIYTQNTAGTGTKTFEDCFVGGGPSGYSFHAYGEGGHVDDITVDNCVMAEAQNALIGGSLPSHAITVSNCDISGSTLRLGWYAPYNEDCALTGNDIINGGLDIDNYVHVALANNIVFDGGNIIHSSFAPPAGEIPDITASGNTWGPQGMDFFGYPDQWPIPAGFGHETQIYAGYIQSGGVGAAPADPTVHVRALGDDRALVDVINWTKAPAATTDLSSFLKPGDKYEIHSPTDVWGSAVGSGTYAGQPVALPLAAGSDFGCWVVEKIPPVAPTLQDIEAQLEALSDRVQALEARMTGPAAN